MKNLENPNELDTKYLDDITIPIGRIAAAHSTTQPDTMGIVIEFPDGKHQMFSLSIDCAKQFVKKFELQIEKAEKLKH